VTLQLRSESLNHYIPPQRTIRTTKTLIRSMLFVAALACLVPPLRRPVLHYIQVNIVIPAISISCPTRPSPIHAKLIMLPLPDAGHVPPLQHAHHDAVLPGAKRLDTLAAMPDVHGVIVSTAADRSVM
jgi:hypothetical protein